MSKINFRRATISLLAVFAAILAVALVPTGIYAVIMHYQIPYLTEQSSLGTGLIISFGGAVLIIVSAMTAIALLGLAIAHLLGAFDAVEALAKRFPATAPSVAPERVLRPVNWAD